MPITTMTLNDPEALRRAASDILRYLEAAGVTRFRPRILPWVEHITRKHRKGLCCNGECKNKFHPDYSWVGIPPMYFCELCGKMRRDYFALRRMTDDGRLCWRISEENQRKRALQRKYRLAQQRARLRQEKQRQKDANAPPEGKAR